MCYRVGVAGFSPAEPFIEKNRLRNGKRCKAFQAQFAMLPQHHTQFFGTTAGWLLQTAEAGAGVGKISDPRVYSKSFVGIW